MQRITEHMLKSQIAYLNRQTGHKEQAWEKDAQGNLRANIGTYHLECAYGGYSLAQMVNESGGITHPIGSGFYTKRELYNLIRAYSAGKTITVEQFNRLCAQNQAMREALKVASRIITELDPLADHHDPTFLDNIMKED